MTSLKTTEEKPKHSYIALISMAILSNPSKKLLLGDIYNYIMQKWPYYNNSDRAWRNSVRHNLSLNECFVKAGRADNGKGHYWTIHPACLPDFERGDFRRRQARRRAKRNMRNLNYDQDLSVAVNYKVGYVPMTPVWQQQQQPVTPTPIWTPQAQAVFPSTGIAGIGYH